MTEQNENQTPAEETWERDVITKLAFESVREQRRSRRWANFFRGLLFLYMLVLLIAFIAPKWWQSSSLSSDGHTALVEIAGVIMPDSEANADHVITGLRSAFEDKNTKGIVMRINSPGGTPVQAGYISDEIYRLREKYPDLPVYAVISDICASGGYYIAAAADQIYADKASIVGSIGVRSEGFGFVDTMQKLGVERRLITAGEHKGFMDPFQPVNPEQVARVKDMVNTMHDQFIDVVKKGRGDRLKDDELLFSGMVWTGEQSLELGLIDGLGSSSYVARELIGSEDIVDFTPREDYLGRLAKRFGVALTHLLEIPRIVMR